MCISVEDFDTILGILLDDLRQADLSGIQYRWWQTAHDSGFCWDQDTFKKRKFWNNKVSRHLQRICRFKKNRRKGKL